MTTWDRVRASHVGRKETGLTPRPGWSAAGKARGYGSGRAAGV